MNKISLDFDIDKKVSELSGGEQQEFQLQDVLLGINLLLLDEPFNSLDPRLRKKPILIFNL